MAKVDKTSTFQGKRPGEPLGRWLQRADEDGLVPLIGERLRAAREHYKLSLEKLAERISGDAEITDKQLHKCEKYGERTRLPNVRALARHLAPPHSDPSFLLRWFVNKDTALCGRPELSAKEQFALWADWAMMREGAANLLVAERRQSGRWGESVKMPDGSQITVYKVTGRSGKSPDG